MLAIAIIDCDQVETPLAASFGQYADMFIRKFQHYGWNFDFHVFNALDGPLPPLEHFAGYLITGSRHDAYADTPWISRLLDWSRAAIAQQAKLVGVCFGHQLLARALYGKVEKASQGWGLGLTTHQLLQAPSWAKSTPLSHIQLLVSHQDQVTQLPANATLLATSPFCRHFMFEFGGHVLTVQGHPEFTNGYVEALIERLRRDLPHSDYQQAINSLQPSAPVDDHLLFSWFSLLFQRPPK